MSSTAELRFVRIISVIIAGASVVFTLLALGAIDRESVLAPAWWTPVAVVGVFVVPVIVTLLVLVLPLRATRIANTAGAAVYLAIAGLSFVWVGASPWAESAWVLNNTALATTMAALALPRPWAWIFNGMLALLVTAERVESPAGGAFAGVQHGLTSFAFCAVSIGLTQLVVIQARRVDARTARAARQSAEIEGARARAEERARVDALLHDTVLATLMLASRSRGDVDPELRRQAAAAVAALELEPSGTRPVSVDPVVVLRERLARVDSRITVVAPTRSLEVPWQVADACADAAVEAARNSIRHAQLPPGQLPHVTVDFRAGGMTITVSDDGAGFSPHRVSPRRLGLRHSIHGRLDRIAGARAVVDSAPGDGTRVVLEWDAP